MNYPDTLVVTATLGNRSTLKRTVESVKAIGGERVTHVIVAPESTCEKIKSDYPHLVVIPEPASCRGIYAALNFGLKSFAKDFKNLTYINDDDFWLPDFKALFETMDLNPDVDVVYGKTRYVDSDGKLIGEQTSSPRYQDFANLLHKNVILFTQQATLTRSDLFLKQGGFDESYKLVADTKFWMDAIYAKAKFLYVNKVCAGYTLQDGQLSSNKDLQMTEHERLISENKKPGPIEIIGNVIHFRIWNMRIYVKRIFG